MFSPVKTVHVSRMPMSDATRFEASAIAQDEGQCYVQLQSGPYGQFINPSPFHPGTWTVPIYVIDRTGNAKRLS